MNNPPKLPLRIFRWFCSEERLEELEGDLYEVYNEFIHTNGKRFGSLFYWWIVIRSFRSYAFKRTTMRNKGHFISVASVAHNLKIAWRNIIRRKTTTAINVVGLAIGIAGFVAIFNLVQYQLSFNKHLPDRDRIYRIYTEFGGAFSGTNPAIAIPVPDFIEANASIIQSLARTYTFQAKVSVDDLNGDKKRFAWNDKIAFVDERYFEVVNQYEWLVGSPEASLEKPNQLVLTIEQARKYFGEVTPLDMVGRQVIYSDSLNVTISGIVNLKSRSTDFDFTDLVSFGTIEATWVKDRFPKGEWTSVNSAWQVIVKVRPKTTQGQVDEMITMVSEEISKHEENPEIWQTYVRAQPIDNMHYDGNVGMFDHSGSTANMKTLKILFIVAFALLLIAIFNFINLETAQAVNKSKEVGLRKSLGVSRSALIARFITESTLVALLAALVAIPLISFALDYFRELLPPDFGLNLRSLSFWISLLITVATVGVVSGFYPAIVASSFSAVNALKSTLRFTSGSKNHRLLRRVLITSQFVFSQILVICTIGVLLQISYVLRKDLGFKDDGVIYFHTPHYETNDKKQRLLNEISGLPQIKGLSQHESPPARGGWSTSTMKYYDSDSSESVHSVHQKRGDENYLNLYELQLHAGRSIRKDANPKETLINETFAKTLGFESPEEALGVEVASGEIKYLVVGILKDFHFQSLHSFIEPLMYTFSRENTRCIGMAVDAADIPGAITKLTDIWSDVYPDEPLEVRFMDQTIENFYRQEKRTSRVAGAATLIAILISSLGLFGLISYNIVQKSKEIGVRKVLGASMLSLSSVLTKEFLLLIIIGFIMTVPIAYFVLETWLEGYSYQTSISWWVYAFGGFVSVIVAILSIGVKVWKASAANPVDSLRYE